MLPTAVKLALSPVIVLQALHVRRTMPRLPEADGARSGVAGAAAAMRPLRLLVVGDSSAAGVGVAHQSLALAEPLARGVADAIGRPVAWRLVARSGVTTVQALGLLQAMDRPPTADVALCVTGVNDIVDRVPAREALRARDALVGWLASRTGTRHVAFAPLPPVHRFPGLPQPLRWMAGAEARRHDAALRHWAAGRAGVSHVSFDEMRLDRAVMAGDGFHPGEPVYRLCASLLARHIADEVWPRLAATPSQGGDPE